MMAAPGTELATQLLATATGALLLTAVLLLWRRSLTGATVLLGVQGAALALLAFVTSGEGHTALPLALVILAVKALLIPRLVLRSACDLDTGGKTSPRINPTTGMLLSALLVTAAFLVGKPQATGGITARGAVPVGIAVVLIGFLVLVTRGRSLGQIIGFVMVDNGIAATAFLAAGGLPLVVEIGVLFDVVLVVLILTVLTRRIYAAFGLVEVQELSELRD